MNESPAKPVAVILLGESAIAAFFLLIALWLTDPWIRHPSTRMLGMADPIHGELSVDVMLPMSFAGWIDFAPARLGIWPLSHTPYLEYPGGASHGDSFDGLLAAVVTAALAIFVPLPMAHSIAVVFAFFMTGWVMWVLGKKLWGAGGAALAIALASMLCPYLMQRYLIHPNLLYIWTIPVAFMAFERWRRRPDWRGTVLWGGSFALMAMASWYIFMSGLIFQIAASVAVIAHGFFKDASMTRRHAIALPVAWLLGMLFTMIVAAPMLDNFGNRRRITEEEVASFSAPLAQYLMPEPNSRAGGLEFFRARQAAMNTPWEAQFAIPLLLIALALAWMLGRGASITKTALILTVVFGVIVTLGPYLQVAQVTASPGNALRLPMHYLIRLCRAFAAVRVPGRMIPVVFFAVVISAGFALNRLGKMSIAYRATRVAWWLGLAIILAFCWWWSAPAKKGELAAWPVVPEFYKQLGAAPEKTAVYDVPFSPYWFPHYDYYQLWHGKPSVSSVLYHDAVSLSSRNFIEKNPERTFLSDQKPLIDPKALDRVATLQCLDNLAREGIGYVVIHPRFVDFLVKSKVIDPTMQPAYERIENAWKARLTYSDERIKVYRTK
ncbi:hypothetical protein LLG95_15760 [bacterium]|nr:hypothetical protein [bacterium]